MNLTKLPTREVRQLAIAGDADAIEELTERRNEHTRVCGNPLAFDEYDNLRAAFIVKRPLCPWSVFGKVFY